jgi:RecB family exonuclease
LYHLDASRISLFLTCREAFRRKYVESIVPVKPAIHRELGIAFHKGAELFWKGEGYETALRQSVEYCQTVDSGLLNVQEQAKWQEMRGYLPDMLGCYFEAHQEAEIQDQLLIEREFDVVFNERVHLVGRIDRISKQGVLYDIKTASAVGKSWFEDLRQQYLRSFALGLYDFVSRATPISNIVVEVCVKPYRGSKPQVKELPLPEIISYRRRFEQHLKLVVSEMVHYLDHYQRMKPWPMAAETICQGKYGPCDFLPACVQGDSPKVMEKYVPRKEHLEVIRNADSRTVFK